MRQTWPRRGMSRPGAPFRTLLTALAAVVLAVAALPASAADAKPRSKAAVFTTGSSDELIRFINERVRQTWQDNEVEPSPVADDAEWIRRVYLDVVGHIPPADEVEKFLEDKDPAKRSKVIDRLLDDPGYVRNWTTVWTNLCVGRSTPQRVSRLGMERFFREAFAKNRPWDEVVKDLVTAEGHFIRNGAVNYLLAQMTMNDEGVQATAKTTRLFMGMQVQCTQCHDHPFNDWKQNQFWEFNSFFRQLRKNEVQEYDPKTGRREFRYAELTDGEFSGPVFFEQRNALMRVAYPTFFDKKVNEGPGVDRREALGELMTEGEEPLIARAMVNRMWGHFLGYGFTRPVDDMGPHNPPSHPELLDRLTAEFVKHRYDPKQLMRWIANSEAYNLTSRFGPKNEIDNPAAGETPLFSHVYSKMMTAEQLFDSLIVATEAHTTGGSSWSEAEKQRQEWLQQFVVTFGTDENDESTTFNGTIPQALMMMNGPLVRSAASTKPGGFLHRVLTERTPEAKKIEKLYLSTLSRAPTERELNGILKYTRSLRTLEEKLAAYQDLFWALLNSNEFIIVH